MIGGLIRRWRKAEIAEAEERAAQAEAHRQATESRWGEVREISREARAIRKQNHLTELFYRGLKEH